MHGTQEPNAMEWIFNHIEYTKHEDLIIALGYLMGDLARTAEADSQKHSSKPIVD